MHKKKNEGRGKEGEVCSPRVCKKGRKERACRGKWRGRVPCNGLHAHVTRFRGEGLMQKNWRKKEKERWCEGVKERCWSKICCGEKEKGEKILFI
jgi:hypothetical protein